MVKKKVSLVTQAVKNGRFLIRKFVKGYLTICIIQNIITWMISLMLFHLISLCNLPKIIKVKIQDKEQEQLFFLKCRLKVKLKREVRI